MLIIIYKITKMCFLGKRVLFLWQNKNNLTKSMFYLLIQIVNKISRNFAFYFTS